MKKFPHEQFLEDNNIDYRTLPEMLYKRIKGFEELKEDLEHTTDDDKEKLTERLEMLSHELLEDLEEHFEDHLENNDQEEEEQAQEPQDEQEPIQEPEQPVIEEPAVEPEPEPVIQQEEIIQETEKEPTDEEILEGLLNDQKSLIQPSELQKMGFKTTLNGKRVFIGKYCLHKGKYDTCYKIILLSE
jgi:hypothetical protein